MIDWDSMAGEVVVVISDLHSNKRAIKASLDAVKANRCDKLIILGDILSYGIDVKETMDMIEDTISNGATLLMGNHDEIYLDLIDGSNKMFNKLREEIQESIIFNLNKLDIKQFQNLNWNKHFIYNEIYYSHANPYGNLWEYIIDDEDFEAASRKIKHMSCLAGVFGHTHKNKCFGLKNGFLASINGLSDDTFVINPGSVGQPRSYPRQASLLRLSSHKNVLWAEIEPIQYDMQDHINDLMKSSLSMETKIALTSFFRE